MAEIPVHKKSSLAWLWWLLALVVLALLLWWLLADHDNDAATPVVADNTAPLVADNTMGVDNAMVAQPLPAETATAANTMDTAGTTAGATGPITDVGTLTGGTLTSMVGRQVNLRNAPVTSVPDDMGFYIGSGPANRVFVSFKEVPSPGQPGKEGQVDINKGSTVALQGEVVNNTGTPAPGIDVTLPAGVNAYIRASRVAVVNQ